MSFGVSPAYIGANANYGTDQSLQITRNDNGQSIFLGGRLNSVKFTRKTTIDADDGITDGGRVYHTRIPGGLEGDLMIARYNGDADKFAKFMDGAFYAGQPQVECTIIQTINNKFDGSKDLNTYTHVVIDQPDMGDWTRTKRTMETLKCYATECL
jgi:hypothetical protein